MGNHINVHDPPTGNIMNTAAAIDVVAGVALLVFSELIHNVIGVVLIAFGLFLFYYTNFHERDDLPAPPKTADRSDLDSPPAPPGPAPGGQSTGGPAAGSPSDTDESSQA